MKTITQQLSTFLPFGELVNKARHFFRSLWQPEKAAEQIQPLQIQPVKRQRPTGPKRNYKQLTNPRLMEFAEGIIDRIWQNEEFETVQKEVLYLTAYLRACKISHRQLPPAIHLTEQKENRIQIIRQLDEIA